MTVEADSMSDTQPPEEFVDLSPSAKLVYIVLREHDELTQQEIGEKTWLPMRTVRYATARLEEAGVVDSRPCLADARKDYYRTVDFDEIGGDEE